MKWPRRDRIVSTVGGILAPGLRADSRRTAPKIDRPCSSDPPTVGPPQPFPNAYALCIRGHRRVHELSAGTDPCAGGPDGRC
jgi:hypothetical protein